MAVLKSRSDAPPATEWAAGGAEALRQAIRSLQRLARNLERAEAQREWMLASIAHDLRLPLSRLRLELELSVADAQTRALMAADIDEMAVLVEQLAAHTPTPRPSTLGAIGLREALNQAAAPFVRRQRLALDNRVPAEVQILADPAALRRVLRNLLDNASRHARPHAGGMARVQARVQPQGQEMSLTLTDEGTGVAPDEWARLAQPFFRGRHQRANSPGTGLGLWTVRQTLQAMGGALLLSSAPGGGLQAEVRLPAARR